MKLTAPMLGFREFLYTQRIKIFYINLYTFTKKFPKEK